MDVLHKLITFVTNPLTVGLAALVVGVALQKRWRLAKGLIAFAAVWLYLWSIPLMTEWIGLPLEGKYPQMRAEEYPEADVICLLGGGMGVNTNACVYPEMWQNADRVWHAARLYKAGKAKTILVTGDDLRESTVLLLADLGVSTNDVINVKGAKNTEHEAILIAEEIKKMQVIAADRKAPPRLLLVTSAWHMRRAEFLFRQVGLDVIPAATDYESTIRHGGASLSSYDFKPESQTLERNTYLFKEHFSFWCYWLKAWMKDR